MFVGSIFVNQRQTAHNEADPFKDLQEEIERLREKKSELVPYGVDARSFL